MIISYWWLYAWCSSPSTLKRFLSQNIYLVCFLTCNSPQMTFTLDLLLVSDICMQTEWSTPHINTQTGEIIKTTGFADESTDFWGTGYVNLTLGVGEGNHLGLSRSAAVTGAATHTGNTHFRLPETLYKPNASRINLIFRLISILNKYYAKKKKNKHVLRYYLMRFCVPDDDVVKVTVI